MTTYRDDDGTLKDGPVIDRTVERNATQARQGQTGRPVLMVLAIGLILAMIVWGAAEIYGFAIQPNQPDADAGANTPSAATAPPANTIDATPAPDDMQPAPTTAP